MAIIKITGNTDRIGKALSNLENLGRNPAGFLAAIGDEMIQHTQHRIEQGVTPTGEPFHPLDPFYAVRKKGPGILRESQALFSRLTTRLDGNTLIWGSNLPYAAVHQFGAVIKGRTIPARPYLGFNNEDRQVAIDTLETFFRRCLGG